MNSISRGWVWKVLLGPQPGDLGVLNPYLEPHQEISSYDPQNEAPNLLRDFAKVGYLELEEALSPNTINPSEITDKARGQLEKFCLDYGPLLERDPSSDSIPKPRLQFTTGSRYTAASTALRTTRYGP